MPDPHTYQLTNHVYVYPASLTAIAIRAIALLQRISLDMAAGPCKCTPCVCLCKACYIIHTLPAD